MARLFQAAHLSVSMAKMCLQFAECKKRSSYTSKQINHKTNKSLGAVGEATHTGHDGRLRLFCMQTHAFIRACTSALSVMTNEVNTNSKSAIPFSESGPWRQHALTFGPWGSSYYICVELIWWCGSPETWFHMRHAHVAPAASWTPPN